MGKRIERSTRKALWGLVIACASVGPLGELAAQPELVEAFVFGSRQINCSTPNADRSYTVVIHGTPQQLEYDPGRGWGYEVIDPFNTGRNGYAIFGPFDDSPNGRAVFPDGCPNDIYDSFIGAKDFASPCSDPLNPDLSCEDLGLLPDGIIFRIDVPNGTYRFVGTFGSADNPHATRIVAENGGEGPPSLRSDEYVVLVNNFDQGVHGAGTFARVGFGCLGPPEGVGPGFVNMDEEGFETLGPPESPTLEVTEGYIRIHQLQGNSSNDPNGGNINLLEIWRVDEDDELGEFTVELARTINPSPRPAGGEVTIELSVTGVAAPTTITDAFPEGWAVTDAGGGTVDGNVITFEVTTDTILEYSLQSSAECDVSTFTAHAVPAGGCESFDVATLHCVPDCPSDPTSSAELVAAFHFAASEIFCTSPNDDGVEYTPVVQTAPFSIQYDEARGYGFEVLYPDPLNQPYGDRAGYGIFGPLDDSPNTRSVFVTGCHEQLYDTFIGSKDFATVCNETVFTPADPNAPCDPPEGVIFRIDVPNGFYRFVAAIGDTSNPHAHRIVVENGGDGPPELISDDHVVLVENFDQSQYDFANTPGCAGCGVFARVGFDGKGPPVGDGIAPDPQFVNFGADGTETLDCPESPVLEVTEGYIRVHALQGNANPGPGRPGMADPNGGDLVLLEIWRVDGAPPGGSLFVRGDADSSGSLNLTDGIYILNYLFTGNVTPVCIDAVDSDDTGTLNLTDGIYVLQYLFSGGFAPPPPHEVCGTDPTEDAIDCETTQPPCVN